MSTLRPLRLLALLLLLASGAVLPAGCGSQASTSQAPAGPVTSAAAGVPTPAASRLPTPARTVEKDPPMKVIGVIGGVSWASSAEYYTIMNELVRDRLGSDYSAAVLMYSIPFGGFAKQERLAAAGDWRPLRRTMIDAAYRLKLGGADFIVIASNTMNSTAGLIERRVGIPVLNIIDVVGEEIRRKGLDTVALLGTAYTMEADFYRDRLEDRYGLTVVTPDKSERRYVNDVIFDQLCNGIVKPEARDRYVEIIERLVAEDGAQGVILGCTEIPLLVKQKDVSVPVFDTTALHAAAAVRRSLGED
jgi:aspartate racemase